jgi:hypothetical protein
LVSYSGMTFVQTNQCVGAQEAPLGRYSWTLELRRPTLGDTQLAYDSAVASEQMFFWGAPLAHVVRYEEHLREMRSRMAMRRLKPMRNIPTVAR